MQMIRVAGPGSQPGKQRCTWRFPIGLNKTLPPHYNKAGIGTAARNQRGKIPSLCRSLVGAHATVWVIAFGRCRKFKCNDGQSTQGSWLSICHLFPCNYFSVWQSAPAPSARVRSSQHLLVENGKCRSLAPRLHWGPHRYILATRSCWDDNSLDPGDQPLPQELVALHSFSKMTTTRARLIIVIAYTLKENM